MEGLHSLSCRAGGASRVSLLSVPRRGWLLSALGRQGLSLLRQGAATQDRLNMVCRELFIATSCSSNGDIQTQTVTE